MSTNLWWVGSLGRTYTFRGPALYMLKDLKGILIASSAWDSPVWSTRAPAVHFALGWYKGMFVFWCVCVDCKQPPSSTPCTLWGGSVFHFLQPSSSKDWGAAKGSDKAQLGVWSLVCRHRNSLLVSMWPWAAHFLLHMRLTEKVLNFQGEKAA